MALQTSGPISLNDIHVEAGGTSGTACTINDSDIRALIGKGSGVAMSFSEWYGASSFAHSATMTVGSWSAPKTGTTFYGYGRDQGSGYGALPSINPHGSLSPTNFPPVSSLVNIEYLTWANNVLNFYIRSSTSTGWTSINVAGSVYNRTSGNYTYNSSYNLGNWNWSTSNPFGTTVGATKTIGWN